MTTYTDHYIAKAEDCERLAATTSSQPLKDMLLDAAKGWRTIAEIPGLKAPETGDVKIG